MPGTIPDLAWYVSTALIVFLMAGIGVILGWGFTLLINKLDSLGDRLDKWIEEVAVLRTEVREHKALCGERHK